MSLVPESTKQKLNGMKDREILHSFYKDRKNLLLESGIYQVLENSDTPGFYLKFQNFLQELVLLKDGIDLALSAMVEINVAGGVLLHSGTDRGKELLGKIRSSDYIVATGVSEPKWEGQLKNLKSDLSDSYHLTGTKSFITNGVSADCLLWVLPEKESFSVYSVDITKHKETTQTEEIKTAFASLVNHLKISLENYPLTKEDLIISDYKSIGLELRLKELFGLVSLLLGFVLKMFPKGLPETVRSEWNKLHSWRDENAKDLILSNYFSNLEALFPFPIQTLLECLSLHYGLETPAELPTIHPDFALFIWEDSVTRFLAKKKKSN
ncbi:acyl-CoA/acyl-ACP dehydrogenase [Leptospira ilyithenensis]|uniref:Acyl-CoA dehydrogenase n=1 Tax=Leptospira ilyithenensis TaxID=2484901 RepID=A0A4R9LNF3_9LEPT|nr:acyl-CoA/acyl-ACP dehydrogenase [Leptospira ilyithenensis]TGN08413.1 acyl-CoA dehydrogenase [Leptospira ilyithenensis]